MYNLGGWITRGRLPSTRFQIHLASATSQYAADCREFTHVRVCILSHVEQHVYDNYQTRILWSDYWCFCWLLGFSRCKIWFCGSMCKVYSNQMLLNNLREVFEAASFMSYLITTFSLIFFWQVQAASLDLLVRALLSLSSLWLVLQFVH